MQAPRRDVAIWIMILSLKILGYLEALIMIIQILFTSKSNSQRIHLIKGLMTLIICHKEASTHLIIHLTMSSDNPTKLVSISTLMLLTSHRKATPCYLRLQDHMQWEKTILVVKVPQTINLLSCTKSPIKLPP